MSFHRHNRTSFNPVIKRTSPRRKVTRGFFHGIHALGRMLFSRFVFALFVLLVLAAGVLYYFVLSDQFLIREVRVEGGREALREAVTKYAENVSSHKRFWFIRQNKLPLFPKETFLSEMHRVVPKVKTAKVVTQFPHTLLISIIERNQKGIWCNYHSSLSVPHCFFYDEEGVIYEDAPDIERGSLVIAIRDLRNEKAELGDSILDREMQQYVEKLLATLETLELHPKYILLRGHGEVSAGFIESGSTSSPQNWEALFLQENGIEESVENLSLVLEKEIGANRNRLEYVDLRLGNKVFFRYRDTSASSASTPH